MLPNAIETQTQVSSNEAALFTYEPQAIEFLKKIPRYKNSALRSALSRVNFFLSVLYCRFFRIEKPLMVVLVTNAKCNIACIYCYGCYGYTKTHREYSTQELINAIDTLWKLGTRYLTIHGGESLIRDDIGLLLNYMKHKGFYVSLNTNGVLVPEKIEEMKCVDTVVVSLDGKEENNDALRGKGNFKKAVAAMKLIVHNKIPLVVSATLARSSIDDADDLLHLLRDIGGRLQFGVLYNAEKLARLNMSMTDAQIREVLQKFLQLKKAKMPVYYSKRTLRAALDWPVSYDTHYYASVGENVPYRSRIHCYHGSLKYQIDSDGRVITCWRQNHDDAPNIRECGIESAMKACNERKKKTCTHCTFLANNEHNALFGLIPQSLFEMAILQIQDALKIK